MDKLRTYAEMLIEKFPSHFANFEEMDKYRIFFPRIKSEHRERILLFRGNLMYAITSVLGNYAVIQDLAMIFRMQDRSSIIYSIKKAKTSNKNLTDLLKKEMVKIHESFGGGIITPYEDTHVLVSDIINNEQWKCLVPKEYLEFATKLFDAIEQDMGIKRDVLCAIKKGNNNFALASDVFIFVFCRKYPDITEKFLAYILERKSHSSISHSFSRQFNYGNPAVQKNDKTMRFHDFVGIIKKKVL